MPKPRAVISAATSWISTPTNASIAAPVWRSSPRKAASCRRGAPAAARPRGLAEPTLAEFFQERARLAINQDECLRCGACADVCPVQCIRIRRITRVPGAGRNSWLT